MLMGPMKQVPRKHVEIGGFTDEWDSCRSAAGADDRAVEGK